MTSFQVLEAEVQCKFDEINKISDKVGRDEKSEMLSISDHLSKLKQDLSILSQNIKAQMRSLQVRKKRPQIEILSLNVPYFLN